ncbi:murein biosynthesis integral membrane protein MurJ [Nocardiopsis sp. NPDC006139]|uniref:murein biosynthesis integral membrane protein MurJ n=1 Tax=Nocardiopsis sp. NPDC006139 TaxID=3154578 RepID=UPI0033B9DC8C
MALEGTGTDRARDPDDRTPGTSPAATATSPPTSEAGGGLMRSSALMALGTTASRLTGFARTLVLAAAVGTQLLGDSYNTANTLSFIVYDLLLGGLMASVIVPFLVRRRATDADGGQATENRLLTGALLFLTAITAAAVLAAESLIGLYTGGFSDAQHEAAILFGRYLLAQILFLGLSGLTSAMLNARHRFAAPAWTPVANNLVIIAVGAAFLWLAGPHRTPESITAAQIALLGAGTTAGAAIQALLLQYSLWRAGFRWRPRLDLKGSGLGEALRAAGWMFVLVCAMQAGFLLTANLANRAGARAVTEDGVGAGLTAYNYAYQLFQLPYAVIAVSVITVLLPRMSAHVVDRDWERVRADFSRGLRTSSVLLVPLSLALVVYAEPLCTLVFARGSTSAADARVIASVLAVFALGLLPFTSYQLLLRVFYATGDTRTPALLAIANITVHALIAVPVYLLLPPRHVIMGIAAGFMLSYASGLLWGGLILSRRLGGLDARRITVTLLLLYSIAVPGAIAARAMQTVWFDGASGQLTAHVLGPLTGCALAAALYLTAGYLLRIAEVRELCAGIGARLRALPARLLTRRRQRR